MFALFQPYRRRGLDEGLVKLDFSNLRQQALTQCSAGCRVPSEIEKSVRFMREALICRWLRAAGS